MKLTGQILKENRENQGLTISEVSLATKINSRILKAIEDADVNALPQKSFLRGFVRSYASFLKLDIDKVMETFHEEMGTTTTSGGHDESPEDSINRRLPLLKDRSLASKSLAATGIIVLIVLIVSVKNVVDKYVKEHESPPAQVVTEIVKDKAPIETSDETDPAMQAVAEIGAIEKKPGEKIKEKEQTSALAKQKTEPKKTEAPKPEPKVAEKPVVEPEPKVEQPKEKKVVAVAKPSRAQEEKPEKPQGKESQETQKPQETQPAPEKSNVAEKKPEEEGGLLGLIKRSFQRRTDKEVPKKEEAKKPPAAQPKPEPVEKAKVAAAPKPKPTKKPKPTEPPKKEVSKPEKISTPEKTDSAKTDLEEKKPQPSIANSHEVILEALDQVSLNYKIDNGRQQSLKLVPGQLHIFKGAKQIALDVKDGGTVNVIYNGRDKGVPGVLGKPIKLNYP